MLLQSPTASELEGLLREGLTTRLLVQVVARCEVVYVGRAASLTQSGEYLLLLKPDGSLQLHGAKGVKPINWQPRTDKTSVVRDEDGHVMLIAERFKPDELVQITFFAARLALSFVWENETDFQLHGSEAEMQARLAANPNIIEDGLVSLGRELPTRVGGIDLYAQDAQGHFVVVEVKRGKANQEAVHQLERYVVAVRASLPTNTKVRGILAAPNISKPARAELERLGLEFKTLEALPDPEPAVAVQAVLF